METNRDLYSFVTGLCNERPIEGMPGLEQYLRALWQIARSWEDDCIPLDTFSEWLEAAFSTLAPAFDDAWRSIALKTEPDVSPRDAWEQFILFLIADLRRMAKAGILDDDERYFGVTSPTGVRWYNFDPCTYLECAVRGCLGGYKEDEVIVLVRPEDGESADSPVVPVDGLNWYVFRNFLECGMAYE